MIYKTVTAETAESLDQRVNELAGQGFEAMPGGFQMIHLKSADDADETGKPVLRYFALFSLLMVKYERYGEAPEERPAA